MISLNPLFLSLPIFSPSSSPHSPIHPTIINCNNIVDLPEVKGSHRKFRTIVSSLIGTCNMVYGVCSLIKKVYKLIQLWGPPSLKRCPRASLEGLLLWWWWRVADRVRPSLPVPAWIRFCLSLGHLPSLFFLNAWHSSSYEYTDQLGHFDTISMTA